MVAKNQKNYNKVEKTCWWSLRSRKSTAPPRTMRVMVTVATTIAPRTQPPVQKPLMLIVSTNISLIFTHALLLSEFRQIHVKRELILRGSIYADLPWVLDLFLKILLYQTCFLCFFHVLLEGYYINLLYIGNGFDISSLYPNIVMIEVWTTKGKY